MVVGGLVLLFGLAKFFGDDSSSSTSTTPPVTSVDAGTPPATVDTVTGDTSLGTDNTISGDTSLGTESTATGNTTSDSTATGNTTGNTTSDSTATGNSTATGDTTGDTGAATTTEAPAPTTTIAFAFGTAPCPKADGSSTKPDTFEGAPKQCIDDAKDYSALVKTTMGEFTIALDAKRAPGNVNNFVTLARYHYFDGTGCHRIITDFVVQCGRPGTDETAPGYTIPDELPSAGEYTEGMVVMANTGAANSGGGQFFIITGAQGVALPPSYSIVGAVTKGLHSTIPALANTANPLAKGGTPPLLPIDIASITITES